MPHLTPELIEAVSNIRLIPMDDMMDRIRQSAAAFVADNYINPSPQDFLLTMNAMLIGVSIAIEHEMKQPS